MKFEFDKLPFFEITPDLVCIAGKDGFFKKVNHSVIEKLGYTQKELFAKPISYFIHPEDKELTGSERTKLLGGKPLINFQNRYVTKNGSVIWLHWTSIYFAENEVVFAIAKDITDRKIIEQDIEENYKKFKGLATHFKTSIENDKKYLAVELHEELAQLAAIVKMDLDWLNDNLSILTPTVKDRLQHASTVSEMLIKKLRRISFSISPNMLQDIGLKETLDWLCSEFSALYAIPCSFTGLEETDDLRDDIRLDIFRICQETLNIVSFHGGATMIKISFKLSKNKISLTIVIRGQVFDLNETGQRLDFTRIRERINFINGKLAVKPKSNKSTEILITIPNTTDH